MPRISVVLPVYNCRETLGETIDSLIAQTYTDWELLAVNEFGSDDGSAEVIQEYAQKDARVHLVQNQKRLGLAESLNEGIRQAKGEFIARIDADDHAFPQRFVKQVDYLDTHPDVAVLGTWQHHYGKSDWVHEAPADPDHCKANMLFQCDLCHSTLMMRRGFLMEHNLYYSDAFQQEDFELWTRVLEYGQIANIPEVLGDFREAENNITPKKMANIVKQSGYVPALALKRYFAIDVPEQQQELLRFFEPPIPTYKGEKRRQAQETLKKLIFQIYEANQTHPYCSNEKLLDALFCLWWWETEANYRYHDASRHFTRVEDIFNREALEQGAAPAPAEKISFLRRVKRKLRSVLKRVGKRLYRPFRWRYEDRLVRVLELCEEMRRGQDEMRRGQDEMRRENAELQQRIEELNKCLDAQAGQYRQMLKEERQHADEAAAETRQQAQQRFDNVSKAQDQTHALLEKTAGETTFLSDIVRPALYAKKKILLVGTPEHNNVGDAAIVMGEYEFLRRYYPEYTVLEVPMNDFDTQYSRYMALLNQDDLIFLQGGGNLGDRYLNEEKIRRRVAEDFPTHTTVVLPQTIFFAGEGEELDTSAATYEADRASLLIFTRGQQSLEFAQKYFADVESKCTLDMAMMLDRPFQFERKGILLCIRQTWDEGGLTEQQRTQVQQMVRAVDPDCEEYENHYAGGDIPRSVRGFVVNEELKRYGRHEIVVTDRLHGVILSLVTHTPCVAIGTFNYKIDEFVAQLSGYPGVIFLGREIDRLPEAIEQAMAIKETGRCPEWNVCFDTMQKTIAQKAKKQDGNEAKV